MTTTNYTSDERKFTHQQKKLMIDFTSTFDKLFSNLRLLEVIFEEKLTLESHEQIDKIQEITQSLVYEILIKSDNLIRTGVNQVLIQDKLDQCMTLINKIELNC